MSLIIIGLILAIAGITILLLADCWLAAKKDKEIEEDENKIR